MHISIFINSIVVFVTFRMREPGIVCSTTIATPIYSPWGALLSITHHCDVVSLQDTDWTHGGHSDHTMVHEVRQVQQTIHRANSHVGFVGRGTRAEEQIYCVN